MFHQNKRVFNLLFVITIILIINNKCFSTPLDDYVRDDDPHFGWTLIKTYEEPDYKLYVLNFTSQKWLDETFSSRSIWWHYLCVIVPHKLVRNNSAFMLIDQGSNTDGIPQPQDAFVALTAMVAVGVGSIGVDLQDIPNQPIRFMNDPTNRSRHEDSEIAWTWKSFIDNTSNTNAPLFVPMAKAAYRAMNATQQFTEQQGITVPKTFIIAGASKRGWATWLTAAVDNNERIIGVIPIVMDILNFRTNLHHHFRAAFWQELQDVTGGTYLRRIPNADHVCIGHIISIFFTMRTFYMSVYDNQPLPKLLWTKNSNNTHGYIRATVDFSVGPKPINATGYHARTLNDKRRDFRLLIADPNNSRKSIANPVIWFDTELVIESQTSTTIVYSLTIENPSDGWEGFFIQVNFPGPDGTALELTTETQIIPDTYPTSDCQGEQCRGTLV